MTAAAQIRPASPADAQACAEIYASFVRGTAVTFETDPPDTGEMARRITAAQETHAWLVAEAEGEVVGYAYAGPYKTRAAYRWSCATSVYLAPTAQGRGLGRARVRTRRNPARSTGRSAPGTPWSAGAAG